MTEITESQTPSVVKLQSPLNLRPHQVSYVKVRALIRKVLHLKNYSGDICEYLKKSGNPVPLNLTEPPSPAQTESAISNEVIIALHEDPPMGVTLLKEANYPVFYSLHSSLSPNI